MGADAYAGLVSMFAEEPAGAHHPDVQLVAAVDEHAPVRSFTSTTGTLVDTYL